MERVKATDFHLIGFVSTHRFTLGSKYRTTAGVVYLSSLTACQSQSKIFRDACSRLAAIWKEPLDFELLASKSPISWN
jgi:hypothetical protein